MRRTTLIGMLGVLLVLSSALPATAGEHSLRDDRANASSSAERASIADAVRQTLRGDRPSRPAAPGAAHPSIAPATTPTITSPLGGAVVGGDVSVAATSAESVVRFTLVVGGSTVATVDAPVAAGTAAASLPTWGRSGAAFVTAADCNIDGCNAASTSVAVQIQNTPPVLVAPAPGAEVGGSFVATATGSGGAVVFQVDGLTVATDTSAPFTVTISTAGLSTGAHTLEAFACSTDLSACDAGGSTPQTFVLATLRPSVTAVAPSPFSPNGDGRRDTATVTYRLDRTQAVTLRVKTSGGSVVRGPLSLGTKGAGFYHWTWNGKNTKGSYLGTGTYVVEITTRATVAGATLSTVASRGVRLDRSRPGVSQLYGTPSTVYPKHDGYRDVTGLHLRPSEPTSATVAYVYNAKGKRIRTLSVGARSGAHAVNWNGRYASGKIVPAGKYTFRLRVQDVAGNRTTTGKHTVHVSSKSLHKKNGEKVVSAYSSAYKTAIGACSEVLHPGRPSWPGSLGYYSDYDFCAYYDTDYLASVFHQVTLPAAAKYGTVHVDSYGGSALSVPQIAAIIYLDKYGELSDTGRTLTASDGWHTGPTVNAAGYVSSRHVRWLTGTVDEYWYDVKSYRVRWTYYVLK